MYVKKGIFRTNLSPIGTGRISLSSGVEVVLSSLRVCYLCEIMLAFVLPQSPDNQQFSDKWTELEFALQMLAISQDEAKAIWSILAAICNLACAGVTVGEKEVL